MHRLGPALFLSTLLSCAAQGNGRPSTVEAAAAGSVLPRLNQACAGTELDLGWMAEDPSRCQGPLDSFLPPDPRLVESLEPARIQLGPDASAEVDYVVRNPTDEPSTFDIPALACIADLELWVVDASGERLKRDCVAGGSCSMPNARVTLDPGGDARFRLVVRAVSQSQYWAEDDSCALHPPAPLPAGDYALELDRGVLDYESELRGSLTVVE